MDKVERNKKMRYYLEITLIPAVEIPVNFIWTKVFTQIHIAIAEQKNKNDSLEFAVSFPEYQYNGLGRKLRIFAEEKENLEVLSVETILWRLRDYVHITSIRKVPESRIHGFAIYSRYQPDNSLKQKAKRYAKRHEEASYGQAFSIMNCNNTTIHFPYIHMKSITNQNKFSMFICKKIVDKEVNCGFGSYGLSKDSTVPEF